MAKKIKQFSNEFDTPVFKEYTLWIGRVQCS